ncbi:DUF418 domain-containing protein [Natronoflexus pectinivorans]|uniref:DUF418 domain-containing protein n=1 Tax=Natronoflexus pectinivorans TaxID=682526 RepID=A0A4V2RWG3_9BACT|nr:DUF418 domain-containing protein [Natronoflexus pectinivorans]TCO08296.1 uncharacterized protein EV194_105100 [Natronoflexus pectinivorans]
MSNSFSPTSPGQRIEVLDTLRGFAIFGILMVNMLWMNAPVGYAFLSESYWTSPSDKIGEFLIYFLFDGKFYVLFSMLFGYGFWLFLQKPSSEGKSVVPTFVWRLTILIAFGALHVLLLWPGDILLFYGIFGLILILFRKKKDKSLIKWAIGILLIPIVLTTLLSLFMYLGMQDPASKEAIEGAMAQQKSETLALVQQALQTYSNGSFSEIVQIRLKEYSLILPGVFFFYPNVLAMFLVGQYAARKRLLVNTHENKVFFKKGLLLGFAIGLPVSLVYAWLSLTIPADEMSVAAVIVVFLRGFGSPLLTFGYVSGIVLMIHSGILKKLTKGFAYVGRMALSNYLMHSIIAAFLFHSYGLGLFGKVDIWQGIALTFIIIAVQIPLSKFWLERFNFGPFEWLWRTLTYRKRQVFRK